MKNYSLNISPQIENDLSEIVFYMKEIGSYETTVADFLDKIYTAFEFLKVTTLLGQTLAAKIDAPTNMRFYIVEQYIIFYEIVDEIIEITRIIPTNKDYIRILGF